MLDKSLIGTKDEFRTLKCLGCGLEFSERDENDDDGFFDGSEDVENIDETGFCVQCWEESGGYPMDR